MKERKKGSRVREEIKTGSVHLTCTAPGGGKLAVHLRRSGLCPHYPWKCLSQMTKKGTQQYEMSK